VKHFKLAQRSGIYDKWVGRWPETTILTSRLTTHMPLNTIAWTCNRILAFVTGHVMSPACTVVFLTQLVRLAKPPQILGTYNNL